MSVTVTHYPLKIAHVLKTVNGPNRAVFLTSICASFPTGERRAIKTLSSELCSLLGSVTHEQARE